MHSNFYLLFPRLPTQKEKRLTGKRLELEVSRIASKPARRGSIPEFDQEGSEFDENFAPDHFAREDVASSMGTHRLLFSEQNASNQEWETKLESGAKNVESVSPGRGKGSDQGRHTSDSLYRGYIRVAITSNFCLRLIRQCLGSVFT